MYLTADPGLMMTMFSILSFARGVAYLVVGPLSSMLTADEINPATCGLQKYRGLVLFVGITMTLSALSDVG